MLNRRILRVKAMQSIYAFERNKESAFHLVIANIKEDFRLEMLRMGKDNRELMSEREKKVAAAFKEYVQSNVTTSESFDGDEFSQKMFLSACTSYRDKIYKDRKYHKELMISETEKVYDRYLRMLNLVLNLASVDRSLNLLENKVISSWRNNASLQRIITEKKVDWDTDLIKQWYRNLKKDEELVKGITVESGDFAEEKMAVRVLIRDFLYKNEQIIEFFEEEDINWSENKDIVKSMLINTVKGMEDDDGENQRLYLLSRNWEEDREFFVDLFDFYMRDKAQYEQIISKQAKKWSLDRIASVDRIAIEMAICEMLNFSSIPVKVTINEYIDIAKTYSTPKSWQFVNGMLDEIAKKLEDEGQIRKTGRGLIDNK